MAEDAAGPGANAEAELPRAAVKRVVKSKLDSLASEGAKDAKTPGKGMTLTSDALLAFSESARVFISYISSTANDLAKVGHVVHGLHGQIAGRNPSVLGQRALHLIMLGSAYVEVYLQDAVWGPWGLEIDRKALLQAKELAALHKHYRQLCHRLQQLAASARWD